MRTFNLVGATIALATIILSSCKKDEIPSTDREYQNFFAYTVMDSYYLWKDEIASEMNLWKNSDNNTVDPIQKVKSIRYKVGGKDYDRWTQLTDNFESFEGSVTGEYYTYGMDFFLYYKDKTEKQVVAVVTVVYPNSPAEIAGIRRGDVITQIGGKTLTPSNYTSILSNEYYLPGSCSLTMSDGRVVKISARQMYENPVLKTNTFEVNGTAVGYLAYNSFTEKSIGDLVPVFKRFKEEGVSKMILDLRYNGGGFVMAENALASMLAPIEAVESRSLFQVQRYNKDVEKAFKEQLGPDCMKTFFETEYTYEDPETEDKVSVSTKGANIDIEELLVIMTESSASASESLVVGLSPYVKTTIIGNRTAGKFCGGYIISSDDWADNIKDEKFADEFRLATRNWGIYVMSSTYYDKDGNNPVIPDGLAPDIDAQDNPLSGYELGDENEPMIRTALQSMGKVYPSSSALIDRTGNVERLSKVSDQPGRKAFGILANQMKGF